jgi:hypothetical protein
MTTPYVHTKSDIQTGRITSWLRGLDLKLPLKRRRG